jgi:SAM-dependent MidA family methyltransferase
MDELPIPDRDAQIVSQTLTRQLRGAIEKQGGWIGFDSFMRSALYEPSLGYYTVGAGSARFGVDGDFVTAPELSPLFGGCIANVCSYWMERVDPVITEFGAGTGQLAAQILNSLDRDARLPERYQIIELSGSLRAQQKSTLDTLAPGLSERVQWLDELPDDMTGVVVANEVLDAMPVRLFELNDGRILEKGLLHGGAAEAFAWQSRSADRAFSREVRQCLARSGWGGSDPDNLDYSAWPDGYTSEIGQEACGWLRSVGQHLRDGVLLALDYGFPAAEFFHPQRSSGTLACHYRHRVNHDPLFYPGLQDITAHVDFTALSEAADSIALDLVGYTSQANFLLNAGLLESLAKFPIEQTADYARQSQAVQKLVSETEMGELFKVIAFVRGDADAGPGFIRRDRSASLLAGRQ